MTTSPDAFPGFELHGAFRSREVTGEAFFSLMRLLRLVGHLNARRGRVRRRAPAHSYVFGFRRLPPAWPTLWSRLLRGLSRDALEALSLRLLEHASARARPGEIQEDLRAVERFFDDEARELVQAIVATGYPGYPVPQRERDLLFLQYRQAARM